MKAISLWQPWATAIALGSKRIETRSWSTSYRGPLAIHAAKRCVKSELSDFACEWSWCGAMGWEMGESNQWQSLPFGAIVATCVLVDVRPTESFTDDEILAKRWPTGRPPNYGWTEWQMGDFYPGRFGWMLANVKALPNPIPFKGSQGFFDVPDGLLK